MTDQYDVDKYLETNNLQALPSELIERAYDKFGFTFVVIEQGDKSVSWDILTDDRGAQESTDKQTFELMARQNELLKERVKLLETHIAQAEEIRILKDKIDTVIV